MDHPCLVFGTRVVTIHPCNSFKYGSSMARGSLPSQTGGKSLIILSNVALGCEVCEKIPALGWAAWEAEPATPGHPPMPLMPVFAPWEDCIRFCPVGQNLTRKVGPFVRSSGEDQKAMGRWPPNRVGDNPFCTRVQRPAELGLSGVEHCHCARIPHLHPEMRWAVEIYTV